MKKKIFTSLFLISVFGMISLAIAEEPVFGPKTYVITADTNTFEDNFTVEEHPEGIWVMHIINGPDGAARVTSGKIGLNGHPVVDPEELNSEVASLQKPVFLHPENHLNIYLEGEAGASIKIWIDRSVEGDTPIVIWPKAGEFFSCPNPPRFHWLGSPNAISYDVEVTSNGKVSYNASLSTLFSELGVNYNLWQTLEDGQYLFRVRNVFDAGAGPFAEIAFTKDCDFVPPMDIFGQIQNIDYTSKTFYLKMKNHEGPPEYQFPPFHGEKFHGGKFMKHNFAGHERPFCPFSGEKFQAGNKFFPRWSEFKNQPLLVTTNDETIITKEGQTITFADLQNDYFVHCEGTIQQGEDNKPFLLASLIEVLPPPPAEVHGKILEINYDALNFKLTPCGPPHQPPENCPMLNPSASPTSPPNTILVQANQDTKIEKEGVGEIPFSDLKVNDRVHCQGLMQNDENNNPFMIASFILVKQNN